MDDDFPLSGPQSLASLKRAHTANSSISRLHRINSAANGAGSMSTGGGSGNTSERLVPAGGEGSTRTAPRARRLNSNASDPLPVGDPVLNETDKLESEASAGYQGVNEEDERILYSAGSSSLARHSSMPVSRVFRKGSNPGVAWNKPVEYDLAASNSLSHRRFRSNSSTVEVRLIQYIGEMAYINSLSFLWQQRIAESGPVSPVEQHFFASAVPHSPSNSGFMVSSRPSSMLRDTSNHQSASPSSFSPTHSRQSSDTAIGISTHSGTSTPSPASPIDPGLLGQANPWSPTAQEKERLAFPHNTQHHHASPSVEGSLRRSNSTNKQGTPTRTRSSTGAGAHDTPHRRSTPLLPPLVTSADALYTNTLQQRDNRAQSQATAMPNGPSVISTSTQAPMSPSQALSSQTNAQSPPNGISRTPSISRILRGPQSAAPYVPPIGHTHAKLQNGLGIATNGHASAQQASLHHNPLGQGIGRGVTTAGPGVPQATFYRDKELVAGAPVEQSPAPFSAVSGTTHMALPFPSLSNPVSAAAFSTNLALQQQLLAAQTQQLQEQQAHLAAALQAGLTLHDPLGHASPANLTVQDPYAIAARIDALQKANAAMAAANPSSPQPPFGTFSPFSPLPPTTASMAGPHSMQAQQQRSIRDQNPQNSHKPIDIPALVAAKGYNPSVFDVRPNSARCFVIKSFTEDDVFKSIK